MFCRGDLTKVTEIEELDIDALFQKTMRGEAIEKVSSQAISKSRVKPSARFVKPSHSPPAEQTLPPLPANKEEDLPLLDSALLLDVEESQIEPLEEAVDAFQPLYRLVADLRALTDRTQQRDKLLAIASAARQIRRKLGRDYAFEWGNHTHALIINPPNEPNQFEKLAKALQINPVAARMYSGGKTPRVVRRSETRFVLEEICEKYKVVFQKAAKIIARVDISGLPPALACTGMNRRAFKVIDADLWIEPHHQEQPEELLANIWLVTIGDVEIDEYRWASGTAISSFGRRKTAHSWKKQRESRIRVVDLHSQTDIIRIVEGVTDLSFLPGYVPGALKKSFHALESFLPSWMPEAKIIPKHRVRVSDKDIPFNNEQGKDKMFVHGWRSWETHTRCCRLLFQDVKR